jgi:hypothetical protein
MSIAMKTLHTSEYPSSRVSNYICEFTDSNASAPVLSRGIGYRGILWHGWDARLALSTPLTHHLELAPPEPGGTFA